MSRLTSMFSAFIDGLSEAYTASPKALSGIRILFAAHILIFPIDYKWVAEVPGAFFHPPPGPFMFFSSSPPMEMLVALEVLRALLAVLVLVGYRTKTASLALAAVLIVGSGLTHSFGKVDHFILYETLPAAMAFAGWGSRYSIDARRARSSAAYGFPMLLWAITVGFALLTAAVPKILTGWLDPSRQATRGYVARDLAEPIKLGPLTDFFGTIDSAIFWKALDYATILAEGWVILAVLVPMLFRFSLLILVGFHAGVYLALGIDFAHYLLVYAVFFAFPVRQWFPWLTKLFSTRKLRTRLRAWQITRA